MTTGGPVPPGSYRVVILTADRGLDADALARELRAQVLRSGGTRAQFEITDVASVLDATPKPSDPTTALVILSSGSRTAADSVIRRAARKCQNAMRACLPIWDSSSCENYEQQLPSEVHPLNGIDWPPGTDCAAVAATILRLLGLSEQELMCFLSYARSDGATLAHQLRHELLDRGWQVFLDTFDIRPGTNFQKELMKNLSDKAFVLLIETPGASGRRWIVEEVAHAHAHKLALLSLAVPETMPQQLYPSIQPHFRRQLTNADLTGPADGRNLTETALAAILQDLDEKHAAAYQLRRETLMLEAAAELTRSGCDVQTLGQWALIGSDDSEDNIVYITARAPQPSDLLTAWLLRNQHRRVGRRCRAWVVHPLEDVDRDRARMIHWLSARRLVRPSPLMMLAERIRA